jgi:beta-glucosidase
VTTVPAEALGGRVRVTAENFKVQEGARRFTIADGTASVQLRNFEAVNIDRETNGDVMVLFTMRVWDAPASARLGAIGPGTRGFAAVDLPVSADYVRYGLPLKCLRSKGADVTNLTQPFVIETTGKADFAIGEVRLGTDAERVLPCN